MTNRMPTPPDARKVIVGVDTHKHVHVAVAIDSWGIRLLMRVSSSSVLSVLNLTLPKIMLRTDRARGGFEQRSTGCYGVSPS